MRRALLLLLALVALLALILLRSRPPVLAAAPPPIELESPRECTPAEVQLSYVELARTPQRTEQAGATQVYGWIVREDDGRPVEGGRIRLAFLDCSRCAESAAEAHGQVRSSSVREIRVQEDGGWYADLPGKCWLTSVEFAPAVDARELQDSMIFVELAEPGPFSGLVSRPAPAPAQTTLIHMTVALEVPLERDALEIRLRASSGLEARGLVFDGQTAEPVPGAHVVLRDLGDAAFEGITDAQGAFRIRGIDPRALAPVDGRLHFLVGASGYRHVVREIAWEPGQEAIEAFKVVLEPHGR